MKPSSTLGIRILMLLVVASGCTKDVSPDSRMTDVIYDRETSAARSQEVHLSREESIRTCMRRQGFDYEMQPYTSDGITGAVSAPLPEVAARSGYGLANGFLVSIGAMVDPDEEVVVSDEVAVDGEDLDDRQKYDSALYGAQGCRQAAESEFPGVFDFDDEIKARLADARERTLSDARYLDAVDEWQACMSDAGFGGVEPLEVFLALRDQIEDLRQSVEGFGPDAEYDRERLADIRRTEIAAASAEVACSPALLETHEFVYRSYLDDQR